MDPANTSGLFCDSIRRDPATYNVRELFEINVNSGVRRSRGVDTRIDSSFRAPGIGAEEGSLNVNLIWTRLLETTIQAIAGGTELDCAGAFGFPCNAATDSMTYPENRITTTAAYRSGRFGGSLTWRWIEGTENAEFRNAALFGAPQPVLAITDTGSKNYLDVTLSYRFSDAIEARLIVANVFDTDPPMMADAVTSNNTDTRMYDIFGQAYTLSLSTRWAP